MTNTDQQAETRYFVDAGKELRAAKELLERDGIEYRLEKWQDKQGAVPATWAIYVAAGTDVSRVFATPGPIAVKETR